MRATSSNVATLGLSPSYCVTVIVHRRRIHGLCKGGLWSRSTMEHTTKSLQRRTVRRVLSMLVLLTVGTTQFRAVATIPLATNAASLLANANVDVLIVQAGPQFNMLRNALPTISSKTISTKSLSLAHEAVNLAHPTTSFVAQLPTQNNNVDNANVAVFVVDYVQSLASLIAIADIVVAHGGTGTALETLTQLAKSHHSPLLIPCPNPALLHDHQTPFVTQLNLAGIAFPPDPLPLSTETTTATNKNNNNDHNDDIDTRLATNILRKINQISTSIDRNIVADRVISLFPSMNPSNKPDSSPFAIALATELDLLT